MLRAEEKYEILKGKLREYESVAVAFSGGVDSALLLYAAHEVLGDKAVAVTGFLRSVPEFERRDSVEFCRAYGIRQIICEINELESAEFLENGPERCYYCKRNILGRLQEAAEDIGIKHLVEGSNVDDLGDYRPGRKAVLEKGVKSPLLEVGLTKAEIYELSAKLGLPTRDKPAYACLASRIASGERISEEKLRRVERAEDYLREKGFGQLRVRVHGDLARIELLAEDIKRLMSDDLREELAERLKEFGFRYVSLDLQGYRQGSMNPKDV